MSSTMLLRNLHDVFGESDPWVQCSFCVGMAAHTRNASTTARKPADMFFRLG
jgi:hypothetical protein